VKKLTILVSSKGQNVKLGNKIEKVAKDLNFSADSINLLDLELPLYSEDQEKLGVPENAKALSEKLIKSDALVVIAPEYNGSIPPCLNNAICWVSRSGDNWREAFNEKSLH
jgi:chromate reductase, NAD(P)H dehydrogenase (quinone)